MERIDVERMRKKQKRERFGVRGGLKGVDVCHFVPQAKK